MTRRQVADNLAYLAAQVTLRNGADYYIIENQSTDRGTTYDSLGSHAEAYNQGFVPCCGPPGGRTSAEYKAEADIVIFRGPVPSKETAAHDAREVIKEVGPRIERGGGFGIY